MGEWRYSSKEWITTTQSDTCLLSQTHSLRMHRWGWQCLQYIPLCCVLWYLIFWVLPFVFMVWMFMFLSDFDLFLRGPASNSMFDNDLSLGDSSFSSHQWKVWTNWKFSWLSEASPSPLEVGEAPMLWEIYPRSKLHHVKNTSRYTYIWIDPQTIVRTQNRPLFLWSQCVFIWYFHLFSMYFFGVWEGIKKWIRFLIVFSGILKTECFSHTHPVRTSFWKTCRVCWQSTPTPQTE